jgi:hypothetical protein
MREIGRAEGYVGVSSDFVVARRRGESAGGLGGGYGKRNTL